MREERVREMNERCLREEERECACALCGSDELVVDWRGRRWGGETTANGEAVWRAWTQGLGRASVGGVLQAAEVLNGTGNESACCGEVRHHRRASATWCA